MKNKITHNLLLKIMSVALAFILWLVVVNINDPDTTKTIRSIDITILNEQAITGQGQGQVYTIRENRTAAIVVKGPRSIVDNLDKNDIRATVDFSEVSSVGAVPINIVSLPDGVTLQNKITENMKITVEPLLTERFQVEIETTGTPADGYVVGNTEISPNVVNIKAPESVMEQISRVLIRVDVDGMSTDVTGKSVSLVLIDGNGKEIDYTENEHITISASTLLAGAEILKCQTVAVEVAVSGEVAEGYRYTGMELSHDSVTLKGTREAVAAAGLIYVPASENSNLTDELDLTELTENKESVIDLLPYLPEGTELLHDSERYVTVTLKVEELHTKSLHISTDSLNVLNEPEGMEITYEVTPDSMIELEGLQADLAAVNVRALNPTIDLSGLGAGAYALEVEVTVPEGITVVRRAIMNVILTEIEQNGGTEEPPSETWDQSGEYEDETETAPEPPTTEEHTIPVIVKPAPEETSSERETEPLETETQPESESATETDSEPAST